jgi:predicted DNA-binding protein (MmcQ/YjbR family)
LNLEEFRTYCLNKPGVTEELPFGPDTLVFKVLGKMFAATDLTFFESINLKYPAETIEELREQYAGVQPGYHMSKKHWNTVTTDGSISDNLIRGWIDISYRLVVEGMPKKQKMLLDGLS